MAEKNIQTQLKTATGYEDKYPTSYSDYIYRRDKSNEYLEGDNLSEVIQNTANRYINPNGEKWDKIAEFDVQSTYTICGKDNFIFAVYSTTDTDILTMHSFDNGATWEKTKWNLNNEKLYIDDIVDSVCIRGARPNNYIVALVGQYQDGVAHPYYFNMIQDDTSYMESYVSIDHPTGVTDDKIQGILATTTEFVVYNNKGNLWITNITNIGYKSIWDARDIGIVKNIKHMIFSEYLNKIIGLTADGKLVYPLYFDNQEWTTQVISTGQWDIAKLDDGFNDLCIYLQNKDSSQLFYGEKNQTINNTTTPDIHGDKWVGLVANQIHVYLISEQGKVGRFNKTTKEWDVIVDYHNTLSRLLDNQKMTYYDFIGFEDKIAGIVQTTGVQMLLAPLFSYE